jgi:hypothetical protein
MSFFTLNVVECFCSVVNLDIERGRRFMDSKTKRMPVVHVAVAREQFPTSQSASLSLDTMGEQLRDKPQGLSLDGDNSLESGVGK